MMRTGKHDLAGAKASSAREIEGQLKRLRNPQKAGLLGRFFKTGPGGYGDGDVFLGLMVPQIRAAVRKCSPEISNTEIEKLLHSKFHEVRLLALFLWVRKFTAKKTTAQERKEIYKCYLKNLTFINNWDLVDLSAPYIVGMSLYGRDVSILYRMARSRHLWTRRVAILGTFYLIRQNQFKEALEISEILLGDEHDLIHKAVGWMLREIGKRDLSLLENYIEKHGKRMPRTMLRYAIERFPEKRRKAILLNTRAT